jgi:hypothetical protein
MVAELPSNDNRSGSATPEPTLGPSPFDYPQNRPNGVAESPLYATPETFLFQFFIFFYLKVDL